MKDKIRDEMEVFKDLRSLCTSDGYIHVIAYFCFRDDVVVYSQKGFLPMSRNYPQKKLTRTEISTLIGLLVTQKITPSIPKNDTFVKYIKATEDLLEELHQSMGVQTLIKHIFEKSDMPNISISQGNILKEAIFYSGESAFPFQFYDFSLKKYSKDNSWLLKNKGYSIEDAVIVIKCLISYQIKQLNIVLNEIGEKDTIEFLSAFSFSIEDIIKESGLNDKIVHQVISSFTFSGINSKFFEPTDFNETNAFPILHLNNSYHVLFQSYTLPQALYENPFYWFLKDEFYYSTSQKNKGIFVEEFCSQRMKNIFGEKNVFTNVNIKKTKKSTESDIDVLVAYADRIIIIQCKSKKLTIAARKGNDEFLKDDFKKAIQQAYDQGEICANCLLTEIQPKFYIDINKEIKISQPKEIYIFCVVSDHYPSLSFQAKHFLLYKETETIMPPYVMDLFFLDVLTEMLQSPLYFLSYINRRTKYASKITTPHELITLFHHLKRNLWIDNEKELMYLGDHDCLELYESLLTRRENFPGRDTPEGILTAFKGTPFEIVIKQIELIESSDAIDLGFLLLKGGSNFVSNFNKDMQKILHLSLKDGKCHTLSTLLEPGQIGVTIHINTLPSLIAEKRLLEHCNKVKYIEKANTWFGLCCNPSLTIKLATTLKFEWQFDAKMEKLVKHMVLRRKMNYKNKKANKIGRNEFCPCGSGKKYKKCCINK